MADKGNSLLQADEISLFCEQVGMILGAGIPLYDGMETLAKSEEKERYGTRFQGIYHSLLKNGNLADALAQSGLFPDYLIAMTRIGEETGKLDQVMRALARYYQWEAEIRTSVISAVLYPTVLILMLVAVVAVLVTAVLPVFYNVYASLGLSLNSSEASLMHIGVSIGKALLIIAGVFLVSAVLAAALLRTKKRQAVLAGICRILPFVGRTREKIAVGRFANALAMMLTAGYQIDAAMEIAPQVVEAPGCRAKIVRVSEEMHGGKPFVQALTDAKLFDEIHEKMLVFGAAAGNLDLVMEHLSERYRTEAEDSIGRMVAGIEPALVTILTLVIGGILLSVTMPLLSILSSLG